MKNNKKGKATGFTLTELVIVIVVIALLAAVLIPTYSGLVNKAKDSNDTSLVKMLNDAMMDSEFHDEYKHDTYQDVIDTLYEYGFVADNLQAKSSKNVLVWNQVTNRFYILSNEDYSIDTRDSNPNPSNIDYNNAKLTEDANKYTFWVIYNKDIDNVVSIDSTGLIDSKYSIYLGKEVNNTITTSTGLDVGKTTNVTTINYNGGTSAQDVIIRTDSSYVTLNIYAPNDDIKHYYGCGVVNVLSAKDSSYHEYGNVAYMEVNGGHVVIENGASVDLMYDNPIKVTLNADGTTTKTINATPDNAISVTNNGSIDHAHSSSITEAILQNGTEDTTGKSKGVIFDYNNNIEQNATNDIFHHVDNQSSVTGSGTKTVANYNVSTAANEIIFEAKKEESTDESNKVKGNVVNANTGVYYDTLSEAIKATNSGDTLFLINDISIKKTVTIEATQNIILDLNEKTINATCSNAINNYGTVIVRGNGTFTSSADELIYNFSNITIENGTFTSTADPDYYDTNALISNYGASATMTILDGTFNCWENHGEYLGMYGISTEANATTIFGDQATGTGPSVHSYYAAITTNGSSNMDMANMIIYGGTYTADCDDSNADGDESVIQLCNDSHDSITLNIYNGTFKQTATGNKNSSSIFEIRYKNTKTVNIYGGQFECAGDMLHLNNQAPEVAKNSLTLSITGGTYNSDPSSYITNSDYSAKYNTTDGTWTVEQSNQ